MTIEEMNRKRNELGLTYKDIASQADMPLSTVQKILGGLTKAPRKESLQKIQQILMKEETCQAAPAPVRKTFEHPNVTYNIKPEVPLTLAEKALTYGTSAVKSKKQGEYTLEDYYAIPDDYRAELIDGVLYDMTAPIPAHQLIGGNIYSQLLNFLNIHKGQCLPMIAPVDVQLDCDNKTMVEPDVLILCDRSKLKHRCIYGAPDFIAEVLSPSTRRKDMSIKMAKYFAADVREYWLVDPQKRMVVVYDIEHLEIPELYSFKDPIPVKVWNCECRIDLSGTDELLNELYPDGLDGNDEDE